MVRGLHLHRFDHGYEGRLPVVDGEEDLLVVVAGVAAVFDEQEAELAGVGRRARDSRLRWCGCGTSVCRRGWA